MRLAGRWFWGVAALITATTAVRYAAIGDVLGAVDAGIVTGLGVFLAVKGRFPWEAR